MLNYLMFKENEEVKDFFNTQNPIPDDSSLMILNLNFPFTSIYEFNC